MDKNDTVIKLYNEWGRIFKKKGFTEDIPTYIIEIDTAEIKRLAILLYFIVSYKVAYCPQDAAYLVYLKALPHNKEAYTEEIGWKGPLDRLNPLGIASATPKEIKQCLKNRITVEKASSLKALCAWITRTGDIPVTVEGLMQFSCVSLYAATRVMYHAWGNSDRIYIGNPSVRLVYRLGWLPNIEEGYIDIYNISSIGLIRKAVEKIVYEGFLFKIRKYTGFALGMHGLMVCKPEPLCKQCIIREGCPSRRVDRKVHTYLDTLKEKGHFTETGQEDTSTESEEVSLASCTESEETISDI